jgi:hypothetical protein
MLSPVQLSLQELPSPEALDQARGEIQHKLAETGSRLAHLNWNLMRSATGGALRDALGKLDLLEYVAGAWCTAVELQQMAKQTLTAPGMEEPFALYEQNPSAVLHPVVKIKCGPVEFPALTFDLKLGASVESAVLIISDGKLAAIEAGSFRPYAQLSYGEHELNELNGSEVAITRRYTFPNGGIPIPCSADDGGDWTAL